MCGGGRISGEGKESKSLIDSKLQIKGFSRASLLAAEEILVKLNHATCMSHTSLWLGLLRQQRRLLLRSCKRPPRCISSGPLTSKGSNICRMTEKRSSCFPLLSIILQMIIVSYPVNSGRQIQEILKHPTGQ